MAIFLENSYNPYLLYQRRDKKNARVFLMRVNHWELYTHTKRIKVQSVRKKEVQKSNFDRDLFCQVCDLNIRLIITGSTNTIYFHNFFCSLKTAHFFRGKSYRAPVCVDAVQTLNNGHIQGVFPGSMRILLESKIDV